MKTREQERMCCAWRQLTDRLGDNPQSWPHEHNADKYLGALKKTPARIHTCGLGMALAFLRSRKSSEPSRNAEEDLSRAVLSVLGIQDGDLIAQIRKGDNTFLFMATEEAIAIAAWMVRFLEGAGVAPKEDSE